MMADTDHDLLYRIDERVNTLLKVQEVQALQFNEIQTAIVLLKVEAGKEGQRSGAVYGGIAAIIVTLISTMLVNLLGK